MLAQWLALSGIIARGRGDRELTQRYCSEAWTACRSGVMASA
jgi:LuxR family maltose regulon positive regulatory protein